MSSSDTHLPLTADAEPTEKVSLVTPSNEAFELPSYSKAASIHSAYTKSHALTRSMSRATRSTSRLSIKKGGKDYWDDDDDDETAYGWDGEDDTASVITSSSFKPNGKELERSLGRDAVSETVETNKMPCAGTKITYGRLRGLMAWRLVVVLDDPAALFRAPSPGTVANFILDTGSRHSVIPLHVLRALGCKPIPERGTQVKLKIQGVHTTCIVGAPGEAGRLCAQFMMDGSLAFYFDTRLSAPVLYTMNVDRGDAPAEDYIQRTVRQTLREKVMSLFNRNAARRSSVI